MSRTDLEAVFLANLSAIDRILEALARRKQLGPEAAEDFASWVKLRLIENDYAIIGKFRGESTLPTYLSVVVPRLFQEYRIKEWGRWRPSAAAIRSGGLGVRLETLVNRDGMTLASAGQLLRTSGETSLSDRELAQLVADFPRRVTFKPVGTSDSVTQMEAPDKGDEIVTARESAAEYAAATAVLTRAVDDLPDDDRLIVRLHFMEDVSVADVARGLGLPQKPLYRRLRSTLKRLRKTLEGAGVTHELARELAADPPNLI